MRRRRQKRRGFIWAAALLGLVLALAAGAGLAIAATDWRVWAERRIAEATGRDVHLGRLHIVWAWPPTIIAEDFRLANADWAKETGVKAADMIRIARLEAVPAPGELLAGRLSYRRLHIDGAEVHLARDGQGRANWGFTGTKTGTSWLSVVPRSREDAPSVLDLQIRDGYLTYRGGKAHELRLADFTASAANIYQPVYFSGQGRYDGTALTLDGKGGPVIELRNRSQAFPLVFALSGGDMALAFDGSLREPFEGAGIRGDATIEGPSLARLGALLRLNLPETPPFRLTGSLSRDPGRWAMAVQDGVFADSPFTGSLSVARGDHPGAAAEIILTLAFSRLRLAPWLAVYGWDDGRNAPSNEDGKLISAAPLRYPGGRAVLLADISAEMLDHPSGLPLSGLKLVMRKSPEEISLGRLSLGLAGGQIEGSGSLDPVGKGVRAAVTMKLRGIDIGSLAAAAGLDSHSLTGKAGGTIDLTAAGGTWRNLAAGLNGHATLFMEQGRISRDAMRTAAVDLTALLAGNDSIQSEIQCFVADMALTEGLGRFKTLMLKTADATLLGEGQVDFSSEAVDITIKGESEGAGLFDLDVPITLRGDFRHIAAEPRSEMLMLKGAAVAVLGLVAPPLAALAPLLQSGLGEDSQCLKLARTEK